MVFRLATLLFVLVLAAPAQAAEPVFPTGLRVGMVPPPGMVPSAKFPGFEHPDKTIAIVIGEFPGAAYAEVEKGLNADLLKAQGFTVESREPVTLPQLTGTLVMGEQESQGIAVRRWLLVAESGGVTALVSIEAQKPATEAINVSVRAALETVRVRAEVPSEELLALLPYTLKDLAGFRVVQAMPNGGALLTDGPKNAIELAEQPAVIITIIPSVPEQPSNRASFARMAISSVPGVKDMHIQRMEPMRIAGQQGFEMILDAKDLRTDTDVTVVQWLRFGMSSSIRLVAMTRKDDWTRLFPRFRALRDGLDPR
jgi:hypothetical protein